MIGPRTEQMTLGDETLTENRLAAPCDEEFVALVERQSRFVFRIIYAALRHSHDAEDVTQEVFLKLYQSGAWEGMKDERAYLARVAWRAAIDRRAKSHRPSETLTEHSASQDQTPEQAAVGADWSALVHKLIDSLPEELRLPLALSATEELTSAEIGAALGIAEGTVRTRLMRAREILKQKLARHVGEYCGR